MTTLSEPVDPLTLSERDPYRVVVLTLLAATVAAVALAFGAGAMWGNRVLLDLGATFVLTGFVLLEVAMRRRARASGAEESSLLAALDRLGATAHDTPAAPPTNVVAGRIAVLLTTARDRAARAAARLLRADTGARIATAGVGTTTLIILFNRPLLQLSWQVAAAGAAACLVAAALCAVTSSPGSDTDAGTSWIRSAWLASLTATTAVS